MQNKVDEVDRYDKRKTLLKGAKNHTHQRRCEKNNVVPFCGPSCMLNTEHNKRYHTNFATMKNIN